MVFLLSFSSTCAVDFLSLRFSLKSFPGTFFPSPQTSKDHKPNLIIMWNQTQKKRQMS